MTICLDRGKFFLSSLPSFFGVLIVYFVCTVFTASRHF